LCLGVTALPAAAAAAETVDMALVLAVDCSYSVDASEFRLQIKGLADAFRRSDIHAAIKSGSTGRIAISLMQWSDDKNQLLVLPWTVLDSAEASQNFANRVGKLRRALADGGTAIGDALRFAAAVLTAAPFRTERRVIDLSSDGRNNRGDLVTIARDEVVARGITINGLPILNEWPTLDKYFQQQIIGGPFHFMVPANDYGAYGDAIARKLLRPKELLQPSDGPNTECRCSSVTRGRSIRWLAGFLPSMESGGTLSSGEVRKFSKVS
jgi:hypothetical protein